MDRGQLISKGPDKWLLRAYMGKDPKTGKRKYVSKAFHGPENEARKALTAFLGSSDRGLVRPKTPTTVSQWMAEWLETKHDVGPKTRLSYEARIKHSINPYLGMMKLSDLSQRRLQQWINEMKQQGLGPRSIQYAAGLLAQALETALSVGLVGSNIARNLILPKRMRKELAVWSPSQTRDFLDWAKTHDDLYPLWTMLLTTGLRPAEALALKWADLAEEMVAIRRALQETAKGVWTALETKTAGSRRSISLSSEALQALKAQRLVSGLWSEWIFPGLDNLDYVRKRFYQACRKSGLPRIKLYACRHTHITHLLMAGVHPKIAADRAGHSSITLTLDTYSHVLPNMQTEAVEKVSELLKTKEKQIG